MGIRVIMQVNLAEFIELGGETFSPHSYDEDRIEECYALAGSQWYRGESSFTSGMYARSFPQEFYDSLDKKGVVYECY